MGLEQLKCRHEGSARARALAALSLLVLASAIASPPAGAAAKTGGHPPRQVHQRHFAQRPAYWGAWIGDQLTGEEPPWDMRPVSQLEALLGKGLSLVAFSSPFADCDPAPCRFFDFPTRAMENVRAYGATPVFNWSSEESTQNPSLTTLMPDFQLADVIQGRYDSYIREFAEGARAWGHPFFLRFDWEMNGNWFPWSEGVNGNQPGEYVAAWRHVHDIFTSVGATNATWVWCPYAEVKRRFAPLAPLYPGNEYVDWTCMDGFNWGSNPTNPHKWRSFQEIFAATYRRLVKQIAPGKPILLAEMASTGGPRAKATWIGNMFKQLAFRYRRVRGLIWFEQVDRGIEWPLESSPQATRAFTRGIRNPSFQANAQASATSPIPPPS
jgi:mannan endo-1,4-beta-mannosidase